MNDEPSLFEQDCMNFEDSATRPKPSFENPFPEPIDKNYQNLRDAAETTVRINWNCFRRFSEEVVTCLFHQVLHNLIIEKSFTI